MQVRSLASETARQTEACGQPSLAWFAADYQEELSAFDGLLLVSSACELARDCCPTALLICVKKNRNKAQPVLLTAFPADRMCLQQQLQSQHRQQSTPVLLTLFNVMPVLLYATVCLSAKESHLTKLVSSRVCESSSARYIHSVVKPGSVC